MKNCTYGLKKRGKAQQGSPIVIKSWKVVQWFGSSNIIKAFENLNYHRLMCEIKKTIDDQVLTNELWQMINLKIIDWGKDCKFIFGTLENSILSFFLFNIYITPFDNSINDLIKKIDKEGFGINNVVFKKRINFELKKYKNFDLRKRIKLLKIECDKAISEKIFRNKEISEFVEIYYVRYADNIFFGFNSSKEVAKKIISEFEAFIKSDLYLSHFSIKLTHAKSNWVKFLGFRLNVFNVNLYAKRRQLTSFQKIKTSLKKKRIIELEKYLKLVEYLSSKIHRQLINSIRLENQLLIKKSQIKKVNDNRIKWKVFSALKASLFDMEAKLVLTKLKTKNIKKNENLKISSHMIFAEQKKEFFLKHIMQKWIAKAQELAIKIDADEINRVVSKYLSPDFVKVRKKYLEELEKIFSKKFSNKVASKSLENTKIWQKKKQVIKKNIFGPFLRIIFPVEKIKKKFRSLGVLNKVVSRPVGLLKLILMPTNQIINWYSLKALGLWNYYCCADNIWDLKQTLNWIFRYSLLGTLAVKHKCNLKQIINKYSLNPKVEYIFFNKKKEKEIGVLSSFPSKEFFNNKKKLFNIDSLSFVDLDGILQTQIIITNTIIKLINHFCRVKICKIYAHESYLVKNLVRKYKNGFIRVSNFCSIQEWKNFETAFKKKKFLLCKNCYIKFYNGSLNVNDLDCESIFLIKSEI